ncbi:putative CRAL-TRIO lipid binding domain-containing protein [Helianthus anomalus]
MKKFGQHIGTCIKILDMTGLRISQLSQLKLLTVMSSIDDLNYPEMTDIYCIVNAPFIFSACWKSLNSNGGCCSAGIWR